MAAIERDDGKRLVRTGRYDAVGDLIWLSLHGAFYPRDLFRASQGEASRPNRSTACLAHPAVSSRRRHLGDVVFPKTSHRPGFSGDRSAICVNAGVAGHVAGDDLR